MMLRAIYRSVECEKHFPEDTRENVNEKLYLFDFLLDLGKEVRLKSLVGEDTYMRL